MRWGGSAPVSARGSGYVSTEYPVEMTLVGKAQRVCRLGDRRTGPKHPPRSDDARVLTPSKGREPCGPPHFSDELVLRHLSIVGKVVEPRVHRIVFEPVKDGPEPV